MNEEYDPYPSIQQDMNNISLILQKTFEIPAFKRDYDNVFGSISKILYWYGLKRTTETFAFDLSFACKSFLILFLKKNGN